MIQLLNRLDSIAPLLTLLIILPRFLKSRISFFSKEGVVIIFVFAQFLFNLGASLIEIFYDFSVPLLSNNYWVHWINTIASFIITIYLLSHRINVVSKSTGNLIILFFSSFSIISAIMGDGTFSFNSYSAGLSSFIIITLCFLFYYQVLLNKNKNNVETPDTTLFWCISGIFTYYFGSFFIFLTYNYLINNFSTGFSLLWRFHNILLLICCFYIVYGFIWKNYQTKY